MPSLHQIIVKPLVTEKSSGVIVADVRTMQMRRNEVVRGRTRGTTPRWKKAVVTLKAGTIPVFEG
jgi:ribosomal protein L23